jgi:hypothetical protein
MGKYSKETKDLFIVKLLQQKTICEISTEMPEVPLWTLYDWRKKAMERGSLTPHKSPGRPKKFSERAIRALKGSVQRDPSQTLKQAAEGIGIVADRRTVAKELKLLGIKSVVAAKRPKLSHENVRQRVYFCSLHENTVLEYWKRWVFSDECSVQYLLLMFCHS